MNILWHVAEDLQPLAPHSPGGGTNSGVVVTSLFSGFSGFGTSLTPANMTTAVTAYVPSALYCSTESSKILKPLIDVKNIDFSSPTAAASSLLSAFAINTTKSTSPPLATGESYLHAGGSSEQPRYMAVDGGFIFRGGHSESSFGGSGKNDSSKIRSSSMSRSGLPASDSLDFNPNNPENSPPRGRNSLGYFGHLPHYLALYENVRMAYHGYKISPDLLGGSDRAVGLLRETLSAFGRLLEGLRFAELAPYTQELLAYLTTAFRWQPAESLDTAVKVKLFLFTWVPYASFYLYIVTLLSLSIAHNASLFLLWLCSAWVFLFLV
ncbi:unnamed protein product [Protopolystoma xenopodis]|uniref:Uncharacterized protein n=1 Tax=Protopolystoma xenopodis TaxID=117903 RepID=A0A448XKW8_9PLAT|nr:unnamed protein product [Protopolystoma xenopodis]